MPDTSCIIAAVCDWHEHHERAAREIDQRLDRGDKMAVAGSTLVEAYAVLTRLPPPHRLSPADSRALLEFNFAGRQVDLVALAPDDYRQLLSGALSAGIVGGQMYDAAIVTCATMANVDAIITFNERHFRKLAPDRVQVVVPA
jgi:predicted nucleic acid-binding protein